MRLISSVILVVALMCVNEAYAEEVEFSLTDAVSLPITVSFESGDDTLTNTQIIPVVKEAVKAELSNYTITELAEYDTIFPKMKTSIEKSLQDKGITIDNMNFKIDHKAALTQLMSIF